MGKYKQSKKGVKKSIAYTIRLNPYQQEIKKMVEKHVDTSKPYCMVCGDTEELVSFTDTKERLCKFCFEVQQQMFKQNDGVLCEVT